MNFKADLLSPPTAEGIFPSDFSPFLPFLLLSPFRTSASCHFLLSLRKKPAAGMPVLRQGIAELNIFYINYFFCCITMTDIVI